ncbi:MAG: cystathionine gamma-synthase family protein [Candidatus Nezhaarchaeota archaeon]|nr:cystathionine gamma-synthase family protein [Candidatus Nezhaarchaeota archaeon]MCX8141681.1 cystathionine gamma-synthase family protein [Candidatus Nezhaarchaeota archaeon]MDW8049948.1 cystathionine gamma-synthase family protein [Nitrososphaerota archaeon]
MQKETTNAIHGGEEVTEGLVSFITPIYQTAVFPYPIGNGKKFRGRPLKYSREDNPTNIVLEKRLATLEGGDDALVFSSGMAAIAACFFHLLRSGSKLVVSRDVYGVTIMLARSFEKYNVKVELRGPDVHDLVDAVKNSDNNIIVLVESISNPILRVMDLDLLASACRDSGAILIVDNTFATPLNLKPLSHGADIVVHSLTKYIAGHNDVVGGTIISNGKIIEEIWTTRTRLGCTLDPHAAFLILRGLKTLGARLRVSQENARAIAEFLEDHPKVSRVYYPGLPSHPTYEIAKKILRGYGSVVSFEIKGGGENEARKFLSSLKIIKPSPSLGGCESLATHPASSSHKDIPKEERGKLGITDGLIRLSIGLEDVNDLIEEIDHALKAI